MLGEALDEVEGGLFAAAISSSHLRLDALMEGVDGLVSAPLLVGGGPTAVGFKEVAEHGFVFMGTALSDRGGGGGWREQSEARLRQAAPTVVGTQLPDVLVAGEAVGPVRGPVSLTIRPFGGLPTDLQQKGEERALDSLQRRFILRQKVGQNRICQETALGT